MIVLHVTWLLHFVLHVTSHHGDSYGLGMGHKYVASITEIPHHVLVVYSNFYCSGTLVRSKIVLTTAGCLSTSNNQRIFVKVGGNSITGLGQVIPVIDIKVHEYFRYYSRMDNDIAMLVLKENVAFGDSVKKVLLIGPYNQLEPGLVIEVSGWGSQSLPQKKANLLLWSDMVVMGKEECVETYKSLITPSNFCAKFQPHRRLSDIGGPATFNQMLVGILSFGVTNEHEPHVAVFTNITYFNRWIRLNTKRFLEKHCVPTKDLSPSSLTVFSSAEVLTGRMPVI